MKDRLVIGTRQSMLALWQSNYVAELLSRQYPECEITLKKILTKGDKILDVPLSKIGTKGLFTKEIEEEILDGTVDLAVHSLKDMPTVLPEGLCLTSITERVSAGDAFVSNKYRSFSELPRGAVIGTSSLRRKAQLLAARPDLQIVDLRGNVDTRLRKLDDGNMAAVILAAAGLYRLGYEERIKELLPLSCCVPAVGQGALAIECRSEDNVVREMLDFLNSVPTKLATDAERAFLSLVEGGCQVPLGVYAVVERDRIRVEAVIASLDGTKLLRDRAEGAAENAAAVGRTLGEKMLQNGGYDILKEIL